MDTTARRLRVVTVAGPDDGGIRIGIGLRHPLGHR